MFRALKVSGNIVDVVNRQIYAGTLVISRGKIVEIRRENKSFANYLIPGLIDAHIHIESSLLTPSEFARLAVAHGTVATVSDPHEIANVMGIYGINYMLKNSKAVPFKFYFGASSCVPATEFETAGAKIGHVGLGHLLAKKEILYLAEMMNYPAVINSEAGALDKIALAKKYNKPIDGHAPGLRGEKLEKYIRAGIVTDHETITLEEGLEKINLGMKVIIREGSAAKNFNALSPLLDQCPDMCMFCSDDRHPDDLVKGHINLLVKMALKSGYDKINALRAASLNPIKHYRLNVGLLQKGDPADLVVIDNFENFNILKTYVNGRLVAENGKSLIRRIKASAVNNFHTWPEHIGDYAIKPEGAKINIISAVDSQLITDKITDIPKIDHGLVVEDIERDILKLVVANRYHPAKPAVAFVKNFGLKQGAIASSFAHDSHNIVAVGATDKDIARAVNLIIKNKGGLAMASRDFTYVLPLPIAGLMSNDDGYKVGEHYSMMTRRAREWGSGLRAPFMALSFMALLVIPKLKLSDQGLFDSEHFKFIKLSETE